MIIDTNKLKQFLNRTPDGKILKYNYESKLSFTGYWRPSQIIKLIKEIEEIYKIVKEK